ncbi:hypothetical protein ACFLXX_05440 [Chloroflexota bacterium]
MGVKNGIYAILGRHPEVLPRLHTFTGGERAMYYEVVWPRGKKVVKGIRFANRLDTLEGKTIGFLWDWMFYGDVMFPMIEGELTKRYHGIKFVNYEEFGSTHGEKEADVLAGLPDKFKQNKCDAVISGVGC